MLYMHDIVIEPVLVALFSRGRYVAMENDPFRIFIFLVVRSHIRLDEPRMCVLDDLANFASISRLEVKKQYHI